MKITIRLIILSLSFSLSGVAQNNTLQGTITDSTNNPMEMVSVALLAPADSALVHFSVTNAKGQFVVEGISTGEFLLQASFIGFQTLALSLVFEEKNETRNLGTLILKEQTNVLSEVIVQGERIPIIINKDTVSYDPTAFTVRADENVEDLLKRLPGVEVDPDGRVTAQGQEVKKVLVDGKEFFGGNVQIATQNLPADAIKKIKFYDRKSEDAMYTGVDDGTREKTMDLELKEDRKRGIFGEVEAGAGTDERFKVKAGVHGFTETSRASVLGNINNVNEYGFNFNDMMNVAGGDGQSTRRGFRSISISDGGAPMPMNFFGPNNGVFLSESAGLNINHDPNKKHRLNLTYFHTFMDQDLLRTTEGDEFNPQRVISLNEENIQKNRNASHRASAFYRWDPDSANRFEITGNLSISQRNEVSEFESERRFEDNSLFQTSDRFEQKSDLRTDYKVDLNYIHKFKKPSRNLTVKGHFSDITNDVEDVYNAINEFLLQGRFQNINQERFDLSTFRTQSLRVSHVEPISKKHILTFTVFGEHRDQSSNTRVNDVETGDFRPALSPYFTLSREQYTALVNYTFNIDEEGSQLFINLPVNYYNQQANSLRNGVQVNPEPWVFFLPYITWQKEYTGFGRLYAQLSRDANLPSLNQWIVNPDSTNPINVYLGNPNLQPEITNRLYLSYYNFDSFNQTSKYFSISGNLTQNPIIMTQSIDSSFARITRPINTTEPRYSFESSGSYRFPLRKLKIFIEPRLSYNYSQVNEVLNDLFNLQQNHGITPGIGINNMRSNKLSLSFRGNVSMNWASYSLQPELDNFFFTQNYRLSLNYTPNKRLTVRSSFNYTLFSQENFADAAAIPFLTASVTYGIRKDGNLLLKLTVFDVLGQNTGIERLARANNIFQTESNTLTRYGMLSLIWRFRKQ